MGFVCLLQPSTCSSKEPSTARPTGKEKCSGLPVVCPQRTWQVFCKPGDQCSSGWETEGCRGVRREGAEMCSGGALSLFVEKVSRLCPVLLDAYQQVIGHGHTQELFAFFLSHLSFCRCHTSGAGFGRSHLSLLKSHLNQNKSTMSGMGQHKHKAIPIKQQREGVHF